MRRAEIKRKTKETDVKISLTLDGSGIAAVKTGIPFFDHMLESFTKHSGVDLDINVTGDIEVDYHHTIEDTGICLGQAIRDALANKKGISRFGEATIPLDEALCRTVIDISGRPYLSFNMSFERSDDGSDINPYLFEEFFRGLANSACITVHIDMIKGGNTHHLIEAAFKSFAKAFKKAVEITGFDIPSTKGSL